LTYKDPPRTVRSRSAAPSAFGEFGSLNKNAVLYIVRYIDRS
jgi:hypothetical protein